MFIFLKSLIFSIVIILNSIFLLGFGFVFIKLFISKKNRAEKMDYILVMWSKFVMFALKNIVKINYNIIGFDKLDKNKNYLIICKHESVWEAFVMHTIMDRVPAFILKNEMLSVPFFGWALSNGTNIGINREQGLKSLKKIVKESKEYVKKNRNIIIFPQGTRVPYDSNIEDYPYKIGFVVLAKELKIDIVPVALNSGKLWSKKQFLKKPGTITMEFMNPIDYKSIENLKNVQLVKMFGEIIENRCKELNKL